MRFIIGLLLAGHLLHADEKCELSSSALMRYEQRVLIGAENFARKKDSRHLLGITNPLSCILEIQERAEGELKYLANSFMRPILGGPQTPGVPVDKRYKIIATELTKIASHTRDVLNTSILAAHSRGNWGLYKIFCEQGDVEFCVTFLPDEKQIGGESPLLASSNMILLRQAFHTLKGKQKDEVAERLRNIYRDTPLDAGLKRTVIEKIYSELFTPPGPLSLQS